MENEKNRVLIVDDEKLNIEILSSILRPDYTVLMAKNGASAIEMAGKYLPDIILLDIIMPDLNGFEVLASLKASDKTKHIPVIIITGLDSVEDEERGLFLGAADFIHKPFSAGIVKSRVFNQMQLVIQIRKLVALQQELKASGETAQTGGLAKSAFLAKIGPEIREPLNAVIGISQTQIRNENNPNEAREAFAEILNKCGLLLGIINDILDLSKVEAGKIDTVPEKAPQRLNSKTADTAGSIEI